MYQRAKAYLRWLLVHVGVAATSKVLERPLTVKIFHRLLLKARQNDKPSPLNSRQYRFLAKVLREKEQSSSQIFQDLWVLFELDDKRSGFFVEFGAADGLYLSNTWLLEKRYGWTGILAEPAPVWWEALHRNRNAYVCTKCVAPRSGEIIRLHIPRTSPEYATTRKDLDRLPHRGEFDIYDTVEVETISLDDLLEEAGAPLEIDYMSIDVEGTETEILETFDFQRRRVRLLTIEHNGPDQAARIDRILTARGYSRCFPEFSMFDGWYRLRE